MAWSFLHFSQAALLPAGSCSCPDMFLWWFPYIQSYIPGPWISTYSSPPFFVTPALAPEEHHALFCWPCWFQEEILQDLSLMSVFTPSSECGCLSALGPV